MKIFLNFFSNGMVKKCLLALNLNSLHYIELINERAHLNLATKSGGDQETANTTKQMKKQILSRVNEKKSSTTTTPAEQVNWKSLKLILELMQACLVKGNIEDDDSDEFKMDINNNNNNDDVVLLNEEMAKLYESFIQLIPYLFLILETIEENFDANPIDDKKEKTNEAKIG